MNEEQATKLILELRNLSTALYLLVIAVAAIALTLFLYQGDTVKVKIEGKK